MTTPTPRQALEESQSLLVATLHERRPNKEIEAQIEMNRAALAAQPELPEPATEPWAELAAEAAGQVCQAVAELPDRDSPADWPEAMLVTGEELHNIVVAVVSEMHAAEKAQAKREPMTDPVLYASPEQLTAFQDKDSNFGSYLPFRKTPVGKFTQPLFIHPPCLTENGTPVDDKAHPRFLAGYSAGLKDGGFSCHEATAAKLIYAGRCVGSSIQVLERLRDSLTHQAATGGAST